MKIGEIMPLDRDIILNEGKETVALLVAKRKCSLRGWADGAGYSA